MTDRVLSNGIRIRPTGAEHAEALEELQRIVFPTLAEGERFKRAHYLKHIDLFPEGQFVALEGDRVVGMTSSIRVSFDFSHPHHSFAEVIQGGWLTSHEPHGPWLYGADVGTHPDYRRRGIARALYAARHTTVARLGLEGQVTVGMLRGYGALKSEMTVEEYYQLILSGQRSDPTISAQLKVGFEPRGIVPDYLSDPVCDGYGVLLVLSADKVVELERR
jgi:GNAT superfamily N-acetyltransferase